MSDAQRWAGCADWIVEQTLASVPPYRDTIQPLEKMVKCKLRFRATPIVIDGDSDLFLVNAAGVKVPNEANGVTGTGTSDDPWTIGGFEFDGRVVSCPAIRVSNIQTDLSVAGNWAHDFGCSEGAIRVTNSRYALKIHDNVVSASSGGIVVTDSQNIQITRNVIEAGYGARESTTGLVLPIGERSASIGILVTNSRLVSVDQNRINRGSSSLPSAQHAIALGGVEHYGIRDNIIEDTTGASVTVDSSGGWAGIRRNVFYRPPYAILVFSCSGALGLDVERNHFHQPVYDAINVHDGCAAAIGTNYWH